MKIAKYFLFIMTMIILVSISSCSSEKDKWFSQNDPDYTGFRLFDIFSGYPAITEAWDKVEVNVFNSGLAALIADTPIPSLKNILSRLDDLVQLNVSGDQPLFDTMQSLLPIMYRIIHQDGDNAIGQNYDEESGTSYYTNFIAFMDKMSASNANLSADLMPVVSGLLGYINKVHAAEIPAITDDLLYMLNEGSADPAGSQNLAYFLPLVQEVMAKMLLINDDYMDAAGTGDDPANPVLPTDPLATDPVCLGNTVQGVDWLLQGLSKVSTEDAAVTNYLNDVLIEVGRLTSKDANGVLFRNVLKQLMIDIVNYLTVDGSVYGAAAANNDYHMNTSGGVTGATSFYVNAELINGVKELWPVLQLLFIHPPRTDDAAPFPNKVDYSILKDADGKSPLQVIAGALGMLYDAGIDYNNSANALEGSLKQMVERNGVGEDRRNNEVSFLDHLLYTLSVATNFGYLTRMSDQYEPCTNHGRGHGQATNGIMTLNDSMFSMRSNQIWLLNPPLALNAYQMALDERTLQGERVGRCATPFTRTDLEADEHRFFIGYDYPALFLLPTACAGDAGIPNGGDTAKVPTLNTTVAGDANNDYRTYFPKVLNGLGEANTAAVIMGMIARVCWEGEGPYYYEQPSGYATMTIPGYSNINWTKYLRPDGREYAWVNGANEYFYPVNGGNDVDDGTGINQRANRFSDVLYTDYYMAKLEFENQYAVPPINMGNIHTFYTGTGTVATNTVTVSGTPFLSNEHAGRYARIGGEDRLIRSNTTSVLTLDQAPVATGSQSFTIMLPKYVMGSNEFESYDSGTGTVAASLVSGTSTALSGVTLTDTPRTWVVNAYQGYYVIIGGTDKRLIESNTANTLTLQNATLLTGTQSYVIAPNSITDASASWGIDQHKGRMVRIGGEDRHIIYNTAKTLYLDRLPTATGSQSYQIIQISGKYKLRSIDPSTGATHNDAQRCMFWEKISSTDADRRCSSQEEAMFRNFQWLLNEKKFVFTIPMSVAVTGANTANFIIIEANGLAGLGNAHKGVDPDDSSDRTKGNGYWIKKGTEGLDIDHGLPVNYGDSTIPGDARVMVFCREDAMNIKLDMIWGDVLGQGHVLPDIIGQNFGPMARMAFMSEGPTLESETTGTTWDNAWTNRSRLFPVVVAAVGELHKRSYYDAALSGNDYNYTSTQHKYPLRTVLSGLVPALAKPMMRRLEHATIGTRWAPRIRYNSAQDPEPSEFTYLSSLVAYAGKSTNTASIGTTLQDSGAAWTAGMYAGYYVQIGTTGTETIQITNNTATTLTLASSCTFTGAQPYVITNPVDLRPPSRIRTLTSILTEDSVGSQNGLIPLIAGCYVNTNPAIRPPVLVSKLMAFLQRIESGTVSTPTKNKIFDGLEQVITSVKASKGAVITGEEAGEGGSPTYGDDFWSFVDFSNRQWLFRPNNRATDFNFDNLLAELIGVRDDIVIPTPGKGLVGFVWRRQPTGGGTINDYYNTNYPLPNGRLWGWDRLENVMNGMTCLLSDDGPTGTAYYAMDNVVSLVNKFLTRVTFEDDAEREDQLAGLRHTLGIVMATHETGSWVPTTELQNILFTYLPEIMDVFDGAEDDLMLVGYNMFKDGGIMPSTVYGLSTHYSWDVVLTELQALLNDPFFVDPAAVPSLWLGNNSLIDLMVDMADMLGKDWYTRLVFLGPGSYVVPYDSILEDEGEVVEFNPYKTLGTILSTGGM